VRRAVCVGIGRILGAGRSVRTRMVACLSVISCPNALLLELCLAWSQSLNLCIGEQIVDLRR